MQKSVPRLAAQQWNVYLSTFTIYAYESVAFSLLYNFAHLCYCASIQCFDGIVFVPIAFPTYLLYSTRFVLCCDKPVNTNNAMIKIEIGADPSNDDTIILGSSNKMDNFRQTMIQSPQ